MIAGDALQIVKLPVRKRGESKELLTLAQLLNGGATAPPKGKPAHQRPDAGAGQSPDGGVPDSVSRAYTREAYIDFLTADDDRINEQVRWAPWSKRPVFGLRLGLGVLPNECSRETHGTSNRSSRSPVPVGPKLVAALDERLAAGAFGVWSPGEDSRLTRVGWLGIGKRGQLTSSAKRQDLDIIARHVCQLAERRPAANLQSASPTW